jgi:hypothetical protein
MEIKVHKSRAAQPMDFTRLENVGKMLNFWRNCTLILTNDKKRTDGIRRNVSTLESHVIH